MRQIYYCPNCARPVVPDQRFCGHCGTCLNRVIPGHPVPISQPVNRPIPQSMPVYHDRPVPENFKGYTTPQQRQIQNNPPINNVVNQKKVVTAGQNARPLRREILKLLSGLMDKQDLNN